MTEILLQPASSRIPREHFAATIESPVSQRRLGRFISAEERRTLARIYGRRSIPTWGITPGKGDINVPTWRRLAVGDLALFTGKKLVYASGMVTHKLRNARLARNLWGNHPSGQTWEYMYFLADIRPQSITYAEFNRAAGYEPGFNPIGAIIVNKDTAGALAAFPSLIVGVKEAVSAREYLENLVGDTVVTVTGKPNRVIAVQGENVIVGTERSPKGQPVPIDSIQSAFDRLYADGQVDISVDSVGHRSAFIGAVLSSLPNAQVQLDPARVQTNVSTNNGWREPPEVADAEDLVGELAGGKRAPGRRQSAAERAAIERRAIALAIAHYKESGWNVRDVGANASYDLQCSRGSRRLHVEVKGTTSIGSKVLLTRNEVNHARGTDAQVALFIVADINVTTKDGKAKASGGRSIILDPWDIQAGSLEALAYRYRLP